MKLKNYLFKFGVVLFLAICSSFQAYCSLEIKKGKEISLDNGLVFVTYTFEENLLLPKGKYLISSVPIEYSVAWPVAGPPELLERVQTWILGFILFDDKDVGFVYDGSIEDALKERLAVFAKIYLESLNRPEGYDGPQKEELTINIEGSKDVTNVLGFKDRPWVGQNGISGESESMVFFNNGKTFDYSILPDIKIMRPLLIKHMKEFGEPSVYHQEFSSLRYPENAPIITPNGFEFVWDIYDIIPRTQFSSEVPFEELIPILSEEALKFIPKDVLEKYKLKKLKPKI